MVSELGFGASSAARRPDGFSDAGGSAGAGGEAHGDESDEELMGGEALAVAVTAAEDLQLAPRMCSTFASAELSAACGFGLTLVENSDVGGGRGSCACGWHSSLAR